MNKKATVTASMKTEKAIKGFTEGLDCSQQVLAYAAQKHGLGLDEKESLQIAAAFGGGMWNGDTCGCVSGALMAIGLKYGHWVPHDRQTKKRLRAKAVQFEKKFIERNGSLICKNILGYDLTIPHEFKEIKEKNLFLTICAGLVCSTCEILDEML